MNNRLAIIDLGTNTFHLLIVDPDRPDEAPLFRESRAARIGQGGINDRLITPAATERALDVLRYFREVLTQHKVSAERTHAFGTSAIRNADNSAAFCRLIEQETGLSIQVINGAQEAEYIYYGVRSAVELGEDPALVVDIGGGSVEFIIGNRHQVLWKQSFEIGGQRLMEKFMRTDPLEAADRKRLYNYFEEELIPLANAVHQYAPTTLVGSSGSFDTLVAMDVMHRTGQWPDPKQVSFELPFVEFYRIFTQLLPFDQQERLAIPGMIALRVDMIVVAVCLIDYLIKTYHIKKIDVSSYALKEGVLAQLISKNG